MTATAAAGAIPWYRTVTREQWRVLLAAKFGWMLDAMDFMLYTMAIGQLRAYFGFGDDTAGMLGTVTLVMSGVGGAIFGYVADRFGRTRALMGTILIFSFASLGAATSQTVMQLLIWRAILGIGMGGEWASGAVLVSETWPAHLRNKAISIMQSGWALGYMMASISAATDPRRALARRRRLALAVRRRRRAGVLHALDSPLRARARGVDEEGEVHRRTQSVRRDLRSVAHQTHAAHHRARFRGAVRQLGSVLLAAGVPRPTCRTRRRRHGRRRLAAVDHPGAARRVRRLPHVRIHRRSNRTTTGVRAVYGGSGAAGADLRPDGAQPVRCCWRSDRSSATSATATSACLADFVAELYPAAVRATGQGTSYNIGRMAGAIAPYTIGVIATMPGIGIGLALSVTSAFFLLAAALVFTLPNRSGQALDD